MIEEIKKRVLFKINSIQFVKRDGHLFLDIEIPESDLEQIEIKSKIISDIIDKIDNSTENYYLNVFSSGTEKEIDIQNINLFLNTYIHVRTNKSYLEKNIWEGDLVENNIKDIVLKVNNKGRFQKLKIDKEQIVYLKTTAKLRR